MAIFYGVHIINLELAAALDLIRFFAEPDFFRRTHITIRGPYQKRLGVKFEKSIEKRFSESGRLLEVVGVGSFFIGREKSNQNTVILKCELAGADSVWKKPDFQDGKPHITLYDGPSRSFALALRNTLNKYNFQFSAKTTNIEFLEKKKIPSEYLQIYFHRAQSLCDEIFENEVFINRFDQNSELERLYLINKVSKHIEKKFNWRKGTIS